MPEGGSREHESTLPKTSSDNRKVYKMFCTCVMVVVVGTKKGQKIGRS